jgi:hypothetical protein
MGLQPRAGHIKHEGGFHTHLPSRPRVQAGGTIVPVQAGALYGGGAPHSAGVHAGGGLHAHVGHPFASGTLPYWQKMLQIGPPQMTPAPA